MRVGLLIITDGRGEYLEQMNASIGSLMDINRVVVVDDSGDPEYAEWANNLIAPDLLVSHPKRMGLAQSIQTGWDNLTDVDYVLHVEEDFTFPQPIPLDKMIAFLEEDPRLAQVCLKRQPWSPEEVAFGGFMEAHPENYHDQDGIVLQTQCFSFNPCVYPARIMEFGAGLEADLTTRLLAAGYYFGYYGRTVDPPRCFHIGARRSPSWML